MFLFENGKRVQFVWFEECPNANIPKLLKKFNQIDHSAKNNVIFIFSFLLDVCCYGFDNGMLFRYGINIITYICCKSTEV
jgi:hypothetical protein